MYQCPDALLLVNHIILHNPSRGRLSTNQTSSTGSTITVASEGNLDAQDTQGQNDVQLSSSLALGSLADQAAEQMEVDLHLADSRALSDATGDTVMAEMTGHSGPIITPSECVDSPNGTSSTAPVKPLDPVAESSTPSHPFQPSVDSASSTNHESREQHDHQHLGSQSSASYGESSSAGVFRAPSVEMVM